MEYTHTHIIQPLKKEFLPFVTTWLETRGQYVKLTSQMHKDKYFMIPFISGM